MELIKGIPKDLAGAIKRSGLTLAPDALKPLRRIDFAKLVTIHDHEEHFLQTAFVNTLTTLRDARSVAGDKITADDVETAILMLGTAAARQAEATLSKKTRGLIKDACGFC